MSEVELFRVHYLLPEQVVDGMEEGMRRTFNSVCPSFETDYTNYIQGFIEGFGLAKERKALERLESKVQGLNVETPEDLIRLNYVIVGLENEVATLEITLPEDALYPKEIIYRTYPREDLATLGSVQVRSYGKLQSYGWLNMDVTVIPKTVVAPKVVKKKVSKKKTSRRKKISGKEEAPVPQVLSN